MRSLTATLTSLFLLVIPAIAQEKHTTAEFHFQPGQSVYVVAVRVDPAVDHSYWAQLSRRQPPARPPVILTPDGGIRSRPTLERTTPERATLDREAPTRRLLPPADLPLKQQIEEVVRQEKTFRLADNIESADFIFFAQGEYLFHMRITSPDGRGASSVLRAGDDASGDTPRSEARTRVLGAAVPAAAYREWQSGVRQLLDKGKWQGEDWGAQGQRATFEEASAKKLTQRFHKEALKK